MAKTAKDLKARNFEKEVLKSEKPVLVDFWAEWCMPCKMMASVLYELADELHEQVKITKLNTESPEHQMLAQALEVRSIPNLKLFKGGKIVAEFVGYRPKDVLRSELLSALS